MSLSKKFFNVVENFQRKLFSYFYNTPYPSFRMSNVNKWCVKLYDSYLWKKIHIKQIIFICNSRVIIKPYLKCICIILNCSIQKFHSSILNKLYRWDQLEQSILSSILLRSWKVLNERDYCFVFAIALFICLAGIALLLPDPWNFYGLIFSFTLYYIAIILIIIGFY